MAVLTYSEISTLFLERVGANVSSDAPLTAAQIAMYLNDAYADVYEAEGGSIKVISGSQAWSPLTATVLTACTTSGTAATRASGFLAANLIPGAVVTGTGITGTDCILQSVTSDTAVVLSRAVDSNQASISLTFTPAAGATIGLAVDVKNVEHIFASTIAGSLGDSTGDVELDPVDMPYIQGLKKSSGFGNYATPQCYAVQRIGTQTAASVGLLRLEFWPAVSGFYFPMKYVPMFTPIDSSTVTKPDCSDLGSRDIAMIAAIKAAPILGRSELIPALAAEISDRNAKTMERKIRAWLSGEQEAAPAGTA